MSCGWSLQVGSAHVGASTIALMHEALQWPDASKYPWERSSVTLPAPPDPLDEGALWASLAAALATAPAPRSEAAILDADSQHAALRARSRSQTSESAVHQLDLRLRKAIASHLQSRTVTALGGPARSALAKKLGERKKETLQACRLQGAAAAAGGGASAAASFPGRHRTPDLPLTTTTTSQSSSATSFRHEEEEEEEHDEGESVDSTVDALEQQFALLLRGGGGGEAVPVS